MRSGDIVRHQPSDSLGTVAYTDDDETVSCAETIIKWRTADCEVMKEATDEEHVLALRRWCIPPAIREDGSRDLRADVCARQLALVKKKMILAGRGGELARWCEPKDAIPMPPVTVDALVHEDDVPDTEEFEEEEEEEEVPESDSATAPVGFMDQLAETVAAMPAVNPEPETPDEVAKARAKRSLAAMFPKTDALCQDEPPLVDRALATIPDPFEKAAEQQALVRNDTDIFNPALDDLLDPTNVPEDDSDSEEPEEKEEKPRWRCRGCKYKSDVRWESVCPGCRRWKAAVKIKGGKAGGSGSAEALVKKYAASAGKRISTGSKGWDHVLGGGFEPDMSVMLAGEAGSGKTTFCFRFCEHIAKTLNRPALFASAEQSEANLASILVRLKITDPRIHVRGNEGDLWKTREVIESLKPAIVIIDSLPKFTMEDVGGNEGSLEQMKSVSDNLNYYGKKTKTIFIFILHFTSAGAVAGGTVLQHLGDATLTLRRVGTEFGNYDPETGMVEDNRLRVLTSLKNRSGKEGEMAFFIMEDDGSGLTDYTPKGKVTLT